MVESQTEKTEEILLRPLQEKMVQQETVLKGQQQEALDFLLDWVEDKDEQDAILSGSPGTGKTFLVRHFANSLKRKIPLFTAPTNEAVRQLELSLGNSGFITKTTYSALGLSLSTSGEIPKIYQRKLPDGLADFDILLVDESSMVGKRHKPADDALLMDYVQSLGMKTLWIGDECQLPPVESLDGNSPVFQEKFPRFNLTEVVRHSGVILDYMHRLREEVYKDVKTFPEPKGIEQIAKFKIRQRLLEKEVFESIVKGETKIICWTNKEVDNFNMIIRAEMFGAKEARQASIYPGDKILFIKPLMRHNNTENLTLNDLFEDELELVCSINTKAEVIKAEVTTVLGVEVYRTALHIEGDIDRVAYIPTAKGEQELSVLLKKIYGTAKAAGKYTSRYWEHYHKVSGVFCSFKHAYSITGHRSQGATIDNVFVDVSNILQNPHKLVAYKNLYVACSRAKKTLTLIRG